MGILLVFFLFFKQKTAYEMRISDWSSDVCSSDLAAAQAAIGGADRWVVGLLLDEGGDDRAMVELVQIRIDAWRRQSAAVGAKGRSHAFIGFAVAAQAATNDGSKAHVVAGQPCAQPTCLFVPIGRELVVIGTAERRLSMANRQQCHRNRRSV